jgi:hypothetical protein
MIEAFPARILHLGKHHFRSSCCSRDLANHNSNRPPKPATRFPATGWKTFSSSVPFRDHKGEFFGNTAQPRSEGENRAVIDATHELPSCNGLLSGWN